MESQEPRGVGRADGRQRSAPQGAVPAHAVDVLGKRVAAFLIDVVIVFVFLTVTLALFKTVGTEPSAFGLLVYPGFLAYKLLAEAIFGRTLGKRLLQIEVIRETGEPAGFLAAFLRNIFLIPGAFLLYIPSLLMMEYSANRQRFGDRMANTLVVRSLPAYRSGTDHDMLAQPALQESSAFAQASPGVGYSTIPPPAGIFAGNRRDLGRLAGGSMIAGGTFAAFAGFVSLQSSTGVPGDEYACYPGEKASIWLHSDTATTLAIVLGVMAMLVVPAVVGYILRLLSWIPIFSVIVFVLVIPTWAVGLAAAKELFPAYVSDHCQESSGYLAAFSLFLLPVVAAIPSTLGTLAGRVWHTSREPKSGGR